ncbi:MAG: acyl carrier protein [Myxococcota bacterium]
MTIDDNMRNEIRTIVSDILEIEADAMTLTSRFREDHDADSLGAVEILAKLEKTFGISIEQANLSRMVNLEGVYTVVAEAAASR